VTFELTHNRQLADGMKSIFNSSITPGEIVGVRIVRDEILAYRSHEPELPVNSWFQALEDIKEQPKDAARLMATRMSLAPAPALASYDSRVLLGPDDNHRIFSGAAPTLNMAATAREASGE
jgi:NitT/TauT family transport system substrate-binding protein